MKKEKFYKSWKKAKGVNEQSCGNEKHIQDIYNYEEINIINTYINKRIRVANSVGKLSTNAPPLNNDTI